MIRNWVQFGVIFLFLAIAQTEATVFYVKAGNGSASPPYSTWNTAAATIQDAVDASSGGDLIWVTNGTYSTGGRIVYGAAMNRVAIDRAVTVQSVNGAVLTIIQGVPGPSNSAVRCVYLASGANLIGFTLKSGSSRGDGDFFQEQCGGGVLCQSISAVVSNCILSANNAYGEGGGTYSGTFNNCTFSGNKALEGGGASTANLNNCVLSGNSATYGAGAMYGALNNCTLSGNNAHDPTGKAVGQGGGIDSSSATNCALTNNSARVSGGAATSANLVNCLVAGNSAPEGGGASGGTLVNCTVVGNTSTTSGNILGLDGGIEGSTAVNCIIVSNTASFGDNNYDYNYGSGGATLSNCCTSPQPNNQGPGNFVADPAFVNYAGADYHLQSNSPCINAGLNASISATNDLDGNPRIAGGTVDIGTYEFQTPASVLSYAWAQQYGFATDGSADYADLDGDGMNNWQEWKAGTDPTSAASVLKMSSLSNSVSGMTMTWQSVSGVIYNLQRSTTLSAPSEFSLVQSNLPGESGTMSYTDTNATGSGPYFYRVGVQ